MLATALVAGLLPVLAVATAEEAAAEPATAASSTGAPGEVSETAEAIALAEAAETGENVEVESLRGETTFTVRSGRVISRTCRPCAARKAPGRCRECRGQSEGL